MKPHVRRPYVPGEPSSGERLKTVLAHVRTRISPEAPKGAVRASLAEAEIALGWGCGVTASPRRGKGPKSYMLWVTPSTAEDLARLDRICEAGESYDETDEDEDDGGGWNPEDE